MIHRPGRGASRRPKHVARASRQAQAMTGALTPPLGTRPVTARLITCGVKCQACACCPETKPSLWDSGMWRVPAPRRRLPHVALAWLRAMSTRRDRGRSPAQSAPAPNRADTLDRPEHPPTVAAGRQQLASPNPRPLVAVLDNPAECCTVAYSVMLCGTESTCRAAPL
jgi:hypothetical protein